MEVQTATTPSAAATGSKTLADLVTLAAKKHAKLTAMRYKAGDEWVDVSYEELGTIVKEVSLGLRAIGIEHGDKVAIVAHTRPEWTYADFGILCAGATTIPVYQTNSPEECQYVIDHSESRAVIVEDASQLAKVREVRDQLPKLEHLITIEPVDDEDVISLDDLREKGRNGSDEEFEQSVAAVERSRHRELHLHVGHDRAAQGMHHRPRQLARHARHAPEEEDVLVEDEVAYLFLPLAHAFARLIQFGAIDVGATIVYWERDPLKIIPNLMEVRPTYFPSVPRIFEKIYALAIANAPDKAQLEQAVELGVKVRDLPSAGEDGAGGAPGGLRRGRGGALRATSATCSAATSRRRVTGAAPIAQEILEFFYACGVPVMEGCGHDRDLDRGDAQPPPRTSSSARSGKPLPGVEVKIADDGEILVRGANIFRGYYKTTKPPRTRSSTAGCTPATSARSTTKDSSTSPAARRTSSSRRAARTSRRRTSRTGSSRTSTSRRPSSTATGGPT